MTPYLGQLMLVAFNFAPKGFAVCNGQLMAISQNQALYALLGTTYGGDGRTTFALPNLQGRIPAGCNGADSNFFQGVLAGTETVTLLTTQIPAHSHTLAVSSLTSTPTAANPSGTTVGAFPSGGDTPYATTANDVMDPSSIAPAGGSQGHENRAPYLVLNWIIALQGIFPSRS